MCASVNLIAVCLGFLLRGCATRRKLSLTELIFLAERVLDRYCFCFYVALFLGFLFIYKLIFLSFCLRADYTFCTFFLCGKSSVKDIKGHWFSF